MLTKELLKQVKQIEIRTRGLVNEVFSGEYHSAFKGKGMEFAEVREYQYGDDIRSIDWNVTARYDHPYIKVFEEERELTVMLMIDMSGSLLFGSGEKTKQRIAAELSSILAFSAMKNNDKVGLILFTDQIEKFVPPRKGRSHGLRIIREILSFEPTGNKTNIKSALEYLNHTIKKKSIVFLLSDFIDDNYDKILKVVGKKHDLVGMILNDPREMSMENFGLVKFRDNETGEIRHIDTGSRKIRDWYNQKIKEYERDLRTMFVSGGIDSIRIDASRSYIKPLVDFFKLRERR